jgi:hypothetical protein
LSKRPGQSKSSKSSEAPVPKKPQSELQPAQESAEQELARLTPKGAAGLPGEGEGDDSDVRSRQQQFQADALLQMERSQRPRHVVRIQKVWGNLHANAVLRMVEESDSHTQSTGIVQRQDGDEEESSPPKPWTPPFKLPIAHTHGEALDRLSLMRFRLLQLKSALEDGAFLDTYVKAIEKAGDQLGSGSDELLQDDIMKLLVVSTYVKGAYETEVNDIKRMAAIELKKGGSASPPNTGTLEIDVANALHEAFREGGDEDVIAELKDILSSVQEYKGHVDTAISGVKKVASKVKATKVLDFVEKFGKGSEATGKLIDGMQNVLSGAKVIKELTTQKGESPDLAAINQFEAAIKGISLGMSFVKAVPLIGQLWSSYYEPLTMACLKNLRKIVKATERKLFTLKLKELIESNQRSAAGALLIPDDEDIRNHFPGGQPVLDYMYVLMKGGAPAMDSAVEQFFISKKDFFNIGLEEPEQIETESTFDIWSPTTWFDSEETAPRLAAWLRNNKATVWASLYGSIGNIMLSY